MTVPAALQKGDLIAFVSPSGRLNHIFPSRIAQATNFFTSHGFRVKEIYTQHLSPDFRTSVQERCAELHTAFADPEIKAVICTIGGLSANELLPHLDYDLIRHNPKIFVGYSDITLLHHALYVKAGLRTFYGPAIIPQFGEVPACLPFTADHFFSNLMQGGASKPDEQIRNVVPRSQKWIPKWIDWESDESANRAAHAQPSPSWKWLRKGAATGVLFGGCLPSLVQLTGTPYLPPSLYENKILLLETPEGMGHPSSPFDPEFARSALHDLRNAGILDSVVGLVVGRPFQYTEEMVAKFESDVLNACCGIDFPILANMDVGHTDPILTLPLGARVELDGDNDEFIVLEHAVR